MEESNDSVPNSGGVPSDHHDHQQPLNLVFRIDEQCEDYCSRCQQLGPSQFGVKMHRSPVSYTHLTLPTTPYV